MTTAVELAVRELPELAVEARDGATGPLRVATWSGSDGQAAAWDAFVERHPHATSDHWWGWRRVLQEAFGFASHYLTAVESGMVRGVLPLFVVPRGFGRSALVSIPFGNYGGVCAETVAAEDALVRAAERLLQEVGGDYMELHQRASMTHPLLQPAPHRYSRFVVPLTGDPRDYLRHIGANNRKKLNQAERRGMTTELSRDVGPLYAIHLDTTRRLGTPCFPWRYFELILEVFGERADILFAVQHGWRLAYDVRLCFKRSMVIQLGGYLAAHGNSHANDWLAWQMAQEACARGQHELDFCRNRIDSGSAQFKRRLHMTETPLPYQYHRPGGGEAPARHPGNPKYRWAIRLWRYCPLRLTAWWGPAVVRYLA